MDYVCNVLVVGHEGSGKTSLCERFTKDTFNEEYKCTKVVDYTAKTIQVQENTVQLTVWDSPGKDEYKEEEVKPFIPSGNCICHVFDITSVESFDAMKKWIDITKEHADPKAKRFIVGLKSDLDSERAVSAEEAERFGNELKYGYMEASSKTGHNVELLFMAMTKVYLDGFVGLWKKVKQQT